MNQNKLRKHITRPNFNIEKLEDRIVLTGGFATIIDGELLVCGTGENDTIVVAEFEDQFFVYGSFLGEEASGGNLFFDKLEVSSVTVRSGDGDDTIVATSMRSTARLEGNNGADRIFGSAVADMIFGGAGDDTIYGNAGDDEIHGGLGDDRVLAGAGDDTVSGNAGIDLIIGGAGDDNLLGNSDFDTIYGSAGDDTLDGGANHDTLFGGGGNDELVAGSGNDMVMGGAGNDVLFGTSGLNTLFGGANDDTINGGNENDTIIGGNGNDRLNGGEGSDDLFGDSGSDFLIDNSGRNRMFGGTGPDILLGGDSLDELHGGIGNDVLVGSDGFDRIFGGSDSDLIFGGADRDDLHGQGGDDFVSSGTPVSITEEALGNIRSIWTSDQTYDQRVNSLREEISTGDLCNAFSGDFIAGGSGRDAFQNCSIVGAIHDRQPNERVISGEIALVIVDDDFDVAIGETITANVTDNDLFLGFTMVELVQPTSHGDLVFNPDGTFTYTQTTYGRDSFRYRASTGGTDDVATVSIVTEGLPLLPEDAVLESSDTGLEYFDWTVGTGDMPTLTDRVEVAYTGYLPDGTVFDSSDSATFGLNGLIQGFAEGVQGMQVGGRRRVIIPPELGYGEGGNPGAGIGGTDTIVFDVRLIAIV